MLKSTLIILQLLYKRVQTLFYVNMNSLHFMPKNIHQRDFIQFLLKFSAIIDDDKNRV